MKFKKKQIWVKRLIPTIKNYTPRFFGRKYGDENKANGGTIVRLL